MERDKVILIFKVRSRIEELEKKFLPPHRRNDNRYNKWTAILRDPPATLRHSEDLIQFRAMIAFDYGTFISTICSIYGDFSDTAAHKVNFPIAYDTASITQLFNDIGMTPDQSKIRTVEVILTPIPLP